MVWSLRTFRSLDDVNFISFYARPLIRHLKHEMKELINNKDKGFFIVVDFVLDNEFIW